MRLPRIRVRTLMIAAAMSGVSAGGVLALIDRGQWIEAGGGLRLEEPWIESRLEWLYLGILASAVICAVLALASGLKSGRTRRPSVRGWIAFVAGAAVILTILAILQGRAERFREVALGHERQRAKVFLSDLEIYLSDTYPSSTSDPQLVINFVIHHDRMQRAYELAARRPWLTVESRPSPPAPTAELQQKIRQFIRRRDASFVGVPVPAGLTSLGERIPCPTQ